MAHGEGICKHGALVMPGTFCPRCDADARAATETRRLTTERDAAVARAEAAAAEAAALREVASAVLRTFDALDGTSGELADHRMAIDEDLRAVVATPPSAWAALAQAQQKAARIAAMIRLHGVRAYMGTEWESLTDGELAALDRWAAAQCTAGVRP